MNGTDTRKILNRKDNCYKEKSNRTYVRISVNSIHIEIFKNQRPNCRYQVSVETVVTTR